MDISGKVMSLLPEQTGQGKNGTWRKQEFILQTEGQYPKKVCISMWGEKISQFNVRPGDEVTASIEIESREFNNRWYTEVKAWRVQKKDSHGSTGNSSSTPPSYDHEDSGGDLPF